MKEETQTICGMTATEKAFAAICGMDKSVVEMEFDNIENLRKELDKVSLLMVTTLNQMTGIHNDLKDLVAAHFAAKKNMKHD